MMPFRRNGYGNREIRATFAFEKTSPKGWE